ncbi:hypothetical protein [Methylophaga sp. OBS3]|uniref:hypothetical protein n=1 Tax=Methylophaga sp. OBS3 TaxID=2991934 RepID=UPI002250ACB9|nr:hypothetical protein [Methylophaga sp. OBS3]MCX4189485.1 hypothetical protein [Methylophaga sp. OBS3]
MQTKLTILFGLLLLITGALAEQTIAAPQTPLWSNDLNPRIVTGNCRVCPLLPRTKWYFTDEWIAVSAQTSLPADISLPDWLEGAPWIDMPPPIWIGKPDALSDVLIDKQSAQLTLPNQQAQAWQIIDKIPQNQSYWNEDTATFFSNKPLSIRGETQANTFIAQTIWPMEFAITGTQLQPLSNDETIEDWVRADQGGVNQPHTDRLIWQRDENATTSAQGKPVLALMLNGAQGDDHEALAGHFALVTGTFQAKGHYQDWLVNNFYSLDVVSEKGIIAAVTPMDKYLADLNSGQNYYRPSYMLVATLNDAAPAYQVQQSMNQVMQHFYRHTFQYQHADLNCTGISIDALKALGWHAPEQGNSGLLLAVGAYFYSLVTDGFDFRAARQLYDYLMTETSRLLPAVAFDVLSQDMLNIVQQTKSETLTEFEQQLADNIDAIWLVKIPQIPSSRAFGDAPVFSFQEYLDITPANRDDWVTIQLPTQQLPESLNTTQPVNKAPFFVPWPVMLIFIGLLLLIISVIQHFRRQQVK